VSSAYRPLLNPDTRLASARAGNVIGGGDWGEDRLLPDSVRAVERGVAVIVRNPDAVRPWQHVLNPLSGYLELAQQLYEGPAPARAFNFGPSPADVRPVGWILARLGELWDGRLRWELDRDANPPEAGHLALDSSAARELLGWRVRWDLQQALERLVEWHRRQLAGDDMRRHSIAQLERFLAEPVA
jgi:CDP-glucose 4,6-dehydratase